MKTNMLKATGHESRIATPRIRDQAKWAMCSSPTNRATAITFGINPTTGREIDPAAAPRLESPVCVRFMPLAK